ncbi:MAG TPA: MBOAT family O-acyltransferase [Bacillota bacterium]|nr:MBOAT family protein [Clostridiales bacterium]HPT85633.1 MBOAT family O-acyltransferase [Bacillota bacterium]
MIFSSTLFLFIFLPVVLLAYYAIPMRYIAVKNGWLFLASLVFYAWGEPKNIVLMLLAIVCNYVFAIGIEKCRSYGDVRACRAILALSLLYNLGALFFFKYFNFATGGAFPHIALPIGISFFTFQIMSYTIDVYRGEVAAQRDILKLGLYISLFPQLIAGPIVRYVDIEKQLSERSYDADKLFSGTSRFIIGLSKKVLISNTVAVMADFAFGVGSGLNAATAWLGAICYALQIYYDFSGYSDMAIGLGQLLGFDFLENFNYPYVSCSVQEFWRRWHISLSSWFRDYLYIPLGGNRRGKLKTYVNLTIVFACTGIWHGAAWSFLVWGLYHGFFLIVERVGFRNVLERLPKPVSRAYTLLVVLFGWVLFRADTLAGALRYMAAMLDFSNIGLVRASLQLDNITGFAILLGIVFSAPVLPWAKRKLESLPGGKTSSYLLNVAGCIGLFLLSVVFLTGSDYNPFIYFRF